MGKVTALCGIFLAFIASSSSATIVGFSAGGTGAPSSYTPLGGYAMTPFPLDGRPTWGALVGEVSSPIQGVVGFNQPLEHYLTPAEWATWSHGYTGDVYDTGTASNVALTLPAGTKAFYFYVEPTLYDYFDVIATANSGAAEIDHDVHGYGRALFYGFYATGGDTITSITISTTPDADGMAIGEFGINQDIGDNAVPEPLTCLLFAGSVLLGLGRLRRRLS